jgi:hypothetical protein
MAQLELLKKIEGLQTADTVASALRIKKQSAINLISKLKKGGYVTRRGGGKQVRLYKITTKLQHKRDSGMFDIINRYSPMKLASWYDHQVHGTYGPEEALIDAIETESFRVILASMRLFNHITDWPKLHHLAKEKNCWQKVGALYDLSKKYFRVKKMPTKYLKNKPKRWVKLTKLKEKSFLEISEKWHVYVPFNEKDIMEIK